MFAAWQPTARYLIIAASGACLLGAPIASGEDRSSQPPSLPNESSQVDVPDQKLDAVAAAIKNVANLKQDFEEKLESAAPPEQERIVNEARDAITKAVTEQGLSVGEYTAILVIAQNVPQVRERLLERIRRSVDDNDGRL